MSNTSTTSAASTTAPKAARKPRTAPSKTAPVQAATKKPLVVETNEKILVRAASLATKAPTDLHIDMARWMTDLTGVEVTPKMAQIVANLRMDYQASESNKARAAYKPIGDEHRSARSVHMTQAAIDAKNEIAKRQAAAEKAAAAKVAKAATRTRKPRATKATPATVAAATTK